MEDVEDISVRLVVSKITETDGLCISRLEEQLRRRESCNLRLKHGHVDTSRKWIYMLEMRVGGKVAVLHRKKARASW